MSILGHDFITASSSIDDILTGKYDRGVKFGVASAVLEDASFRANVPSDQYENNYLVWHKIYTSMEAAYDIVWQLANKATLDENDMAKLNSIKKRNDEKKQSEYWLY